MFKRFLLVAAVCLLALPMTAKAQNLAFQWDLRGPDGLYSHTPSDPIGTWTFIADATLPPGSVWDVIAADTDSAGTFYGVDFNSLTLGIIDTVTASFTSVAVLSGDIPPGVNAMTIDPSNDLGWISDGLGLWTMDLTTGVCTQVATEFLDGVTPLTQVWELATDGAGNFWAFDVFTDNLYELDETTGVCTLLGNYTLGDAVFSNNGMDWDPDSGQLIGDVYTGGGTGTLGTWNTTTGVFTLILDHSAYPLADARVGGPIGCFGGTTFQVNFYLNTFITYDTLNPAGGVTSIDQKETPPPAMFAMDFNADGSVLFAIDRSIESLGIIDITTADFTPTIALSGDYTGGVVGMTCDPSTGDYYICNTTTLWTLDVVTGNTVLIGDFEGPPLAQDPDTIIELACNNAGDMYVFTIGDDALYSVDKTNAESTFLGFAPVNSGFIQGLDFDPETDELYASMYISGGTGLYGTWDTTTGVFTTIALIEDFPPGGGGNYEMKLAIQPILTGPVTVTGDSFTVTRGTYVSGGLPELADSDNMDLSLRRNSGDTSSRTEFEVKGTSPTETPSSFGITVEGSAFFRSTVVQTIELFNYDAGTWELVDTRNASRLVDSVVSLTGFGGDLGRFVENGTRSIEVRVHFESLSRRQNFASNTDQVIWTISQ